VNSPQYARPRPDAGPGCDASVGPPSGSVLPRRIRAPWSAPGQEPHPVEHHQDLAPCRCPLSRRPAARAPALRRSESRRWPTRRLRVRDCTSPSQNGAGRFRERPPRGALVPYVTRPCWLPWSHSSGGCSGGLDFARMSTGGVPRGRRGRFVGGRDTGTRRPGGSVGAGARGTRASRRYSRASSRAEPDRARG
jgi:hypothetical protein